MSDHEEEDEEYRVMRVRKAVAKFVRVPLDDVEYRELHSYINPPVCSLEVRDKGLYFALDVVLDFDVETYVVPYGEKVKMPRDVHRSLRNFLLRTGRIERPDPD